MKILEAKIQHVKAKKAALLSLLLLAISQPALAAGGLDSATRWVDEVTTWAYGITGAVAILYCIYLVIMAFMERKEWSDVFMGMVKTAVAGGVVVGATFAWSIWGS